MPPLAPLGTAQVWCPPLQPVTTAVKACVPVLQPPLPDGVVGCALTCWRAPLHHLLPASPRRSRPSAIPAQTRALVGGAADGTPQGPPAPRSPPPPPAPPHPTGVASITGAAVGARTSGGGRCRRHTHALPAGGALSPRRHDGSGAHSPRRGRGRRRGSRHLTIHPLVSRRQLQCVAC